MDNNRTLIYLAALLHDIGKFYQRADRNEVLTSSRLSDAAKKRESELCPEYHGRYSHKHVLWTAGFVEQLIPHLTKTVSGFHHRDGDILLRTAAAHHRPENFLESIVQKADHYSSGTDRSQHPAAWKDAEEEEKIWDSFKRVAMCSVFEGIRLGYGSDTVTDVGYKYRLPVDELVVSDRLFPKQDVVVNVDDYEALWDRFSSDVLRIQSKSLRGFAENLLFLLERYTSRMPSSTSYLPDVSLYDHAKTTAAFALCLYDYLNEKQVDHIGSDTLKNQQPFLLVGGDLSGIQKFIYDIIAKGAAKNLKGRSFYLQVVVENVVQHILTKLDLFEANVVYSSGGGFYLLAPNTPGNFERIQVLEQQVNERLFDNHGTALYLALDAVPFGEETLYFQKNNEGIGELWHALTEKLGRKKGQRFKAILTDKYDKLFEPIQVNPIDKRDAITQEELVDPVELDEGIIVNRTTEKQISLGKVLKDTDYWIICREKLDYLNVGREREHHPLGLYYNYFLRREDLVRAQQQLRGSIDNAKILLFNDPGALTQQDLGIDNIYGFAWYGGNDYPVNRDGEPKTFTELCGVADDQDDAFRTREDAPNLVRLGVLRMDVDNLGTIFKRGMDPDKRSFSRYSTLSRSLDYFFKGYLNRIRQEAVCNQTAANDYTQIIYAGGDDLLIVGKWDLLPELAKCIQQEFAQWTCHNRDLTLSGGIAVVGPKSPLLKAAEQSEAFEKAAKSHRYNGSDKNAFSMLSYRSYRKDASIEIEDVRFAFNWLEEMPVIMGLKNQLISLIKEGDLPKGFPADVFNFMQRAEFHYSSAIDKYVLGNYRVIWLIVYQFKRAMGQGDKSERRNDFLERWIRNIMINEVRDEKGIRQMEHTPYHALQVLAFAARWASLAIRSELFNH